MFSTGKKELVVCRECVTAALQTILTLQRKCISTRPLMEQPVGTLTIYCSTTQHFSCATKYYDSTTSPHLHVPFTFQTFCTLSQLGKSSGWSIPPYMVHLTTYVPASVDKRISRAQLLFVIL